MKTPRGEQLSLAREQESHVPLRIAARLGRFALGFGWSAYVVGCTQGLMFDNDQPFNPINAFETTANSTAITYNYLTRSDTCLPPPSAEESERFIGAEYSWPEEFTSIEAYAASHNLTLADYEYTRAHAERLFEADSLEEITDILNDFTQGEYNIETRMDGFTEHPDKVPKIEDLRWKSQRFLSMLSLTPKEVFTAVDLNTIELRPLYTETFDGKIGNIGEFGYGSDGAVVVINIDNLDSKDIYIHELIGHGIQNTACDGFYATRPDEADRDDAITQHNPPSEPYAENAPNLADVDTYDGEFNADVFASDYAQDNVNEDVAELTKVLITGRFVLTEEQYNTPVGQKAAVVLDRIDQVVTPGAAEYLMTTFHEN